MAYPLVSIITVNYDHPEVTCELLASLQQITYPNTEVIVVDNASPTDDPSVIKELYPFINFVKSEKNLGFAGGTNMGIRLAKGKYILLLNNDTEVDRSFLEPLVNKLESDATIGAVSPKIRFFSKPDTFQYAGFSPINPYTIRSHRIGDHMPDRGQFDRDAPTAFVHGAAMMVPAEVLRKVGLLAECYFLYYEELDWGTRIRREGYQLWYVHNSVVYHKESISTGRLSTLKIYYLNRARLLYLRRNIHGFQFLVAVCYQVFISVPKNTLNYLFRGKKGQLKAYLRAIGWHLQNLFAADIHSHPVL
jgi:GT2 family glycosyltransferase